MIKVAGYVLFAGAAGVMLFSALRFGEFRIRAWKPTGWLWANRHPASAAVLLPIIIAAAVVVPIFFVLIGTEGGVVIRSVTAVAVAAIALWHVRQIQYAKSQNPPRGFVAVEYLSMALWSGAMLLCFVIPHR
jgi:hypothetical protein